jgi:anti-sigma factor RsiW
MTPPTAPDDPILLVHAYVDGELDPAHAIELERRLATDPALAAERDRVEALRRLIRERLPREAPPPALVRRIEAAVGLHRAPARPSWRALAASVVLAMMVASSGTWLVLRPGPADGMADMVVAGHMRALMAREPTDVASSDRHTVKPWFSGRIPQAPRVVDLAGEGFPLVGGRIDVISRVPVPTLVYRHRAHLISLTEVPAEGGADTRPVSRAIVGYNVLSWTESGVAYWAVSDLAPADLESFVKAFRAGIPEG